jgi:hypothetical protein
MVWFIRNIPYFYEGGLYPGFQLSNVFSKISQEGCCLRTLAVSQLPTVRFPVALTNGRKWVIAVQLVKHPISTAFATAGSIYLDNIAVIVSHSRSPLHRGVSRGIASLVSSPKVE